MSQYLLVIQGDPNDADYVEESTSFTAKEFEEFKPTLLKVVAALSEGGKKRHNWDDPEEQYVETGLLTEEELEEFYNYIPSGGEESIHSITGISYYKVTETKTLL